MTALGSDAAQALAPDWVAASIFGLCLVIAPLAAVALSRMRERRRAAKARASAPDYGQLTPREQFAWRHVSAAYHLPSAVLEEDRHPARQPEAASWWQLLVGALGREPYPVLPGRQNDEPEEEYLP